MWDDFKKLLSGPMLYRLDALIAVRLVPIFYALGLAAIGLWAIDHLFAAFEFNFGQGLWGLLEILVYGPLAVLALRIICELILVFFKAHEAAAAAVDRRRGRNSLLEDVGDAIHDLAEEDDDIPPLSDPFPMAGTGTPKPPTEDIDPIIKGSVRRTARRSPAARG